MDSAVEPATCHGLVVGLAAGADGDVALASVSRAIASRSACRGHRRPEIATSGRGGVEPGVAGGGRTTVRFVADQLEPLVSDRQLDGGRAGISTTTHSQESWSGPRPRRVPRPGRRPAIGGDDDGEQRHRHGGAGYRRGQISRRHRRRRGFKCNIATVCFHRDRGRPSTGRKNGLNRRKIRSSSRRRSRRAHPTAPASLRQHQLEQGACGLQFATRTHERSSGMHHPRSAEYAEASEPLPASTPLLLLTPP